MERNLLSKAMEFINIQRMKRRWHKAGTAMAAVVVFCTTYALIIPAITLEGRVFCGQEVHTHEADCYGQVLICDLSDAQVHIHTDGCYQTERTMVCSLEESVGHSHTETCMAAESVLTCSSEEEGHEHGDGCYTVTTVNVCGQAETSGHTHGSGCWQETRTLVCTENTEATVPDHVHGEECYGTSGAPTCGLEEHVHDDACRSDPKADLETQADWEETLADVVLTGEYPTDILAIAETQLGYTESTDNYIVNDEGRTLGYSRYGAWYGDAYGDWCAMFVSFCLHYAEISDDDFPREANCQRWIGELAQRDLYRQSDSYTPKPGDLIFFNWDESSNADHVGLVEEVVLDQDGNCKEIKTIEGNSSNKVRRETYQWGASSILGYGVLPQGKVSQTQDGLEQETGGEDVDNGFISWDGLLEQIHQEDILKGPVVRIYAKSMESVPAAFSVRGIQRSGVMMYTAQESTDSSEGTIIDLKNYLIDKGGSYTFLLTNINDEELPREDGNYIVTSGTSYKLTLQIESESGLAPGTYQYKLPAGLTVIGGTGDFEIDGTIVGTWTVDEDGMMTFVLDEGMNNRTEVIISAEMGVSFQETSTSIKFDGGITIVVEPSADTGTNTVLTKFSPKTEDGQIQWRVVIEGHDRSRIVGSLLTDEITTPNHSYTEEDMAKGLAFGVSQPNPETGEELAWHQWVVYPGDPGLTWTEDGWSYTMPATATCQWCGEILLGEDGWVYYIDYFSTPDPISSVGTVTYENHASLENKDDYGWVQIQHGEAVAQILKNGHFEGDTAGGKFVWEVRTLIPGMKTDGKSDFYWYIMDEMEILRADDSHAGHAENTMHLAKVYMVTQDGQRVEVPELTQAGPNDRVAWKNGWTATTDSTNEEVAYGRQMDLLCRCNCTEETCVSWTANGCTESAWNPGRFCYCWTIQEDVEFVFVYETRNPELFEKFGDGSYKLKNKVDLGKRKPNWDAMIQTGDSVTVPIPSQFSKELTQLFDGYTAKYTITVNEGKVALTDGSPLTIYDKMTDTLAYIAGSLVITYEDGNNQTGTLRENVDYTVAYDGSGKQTLNGNPVHVLEIEILRPQSVMYILNYDATLLMPTTAGNGIKYKNAAYVTLEGGQLSTGTVEKTYTNVNISAETYCINVWKTDDAGVPLSGAKFGLYNEIGNVVSLGETEDGKLKFETDQINAIILRNHVPYYIQEIQAPEGYFKDGTKHWFYFCNQGDGCKTCGGMDLESYPGIEPVPSEYTFHLTNQPGVYELPETGGMGIPLYCLACVALTICVSAAVVTRKRAS